MKIIADTATLFSPEEGKKEGITIIPVSVAIGDKSYKDFVEINTEEFLELVQAGGIPMSSQPSIGEILDELENETDEILMLTVGDGLSGAYQNAVGAKNSLDENEHIHIVNSKTLAGAFRYIARKAADLREQGLSAAAIVEALEECIESSRSFVIPEDFEFLKRSGRLTPIAAKIGGLIKIVPVLTQTEDKTRITPFAIKRSWKKAVEAIAEHLESLGVNETYQISVCHGGAREKAVQVMEQLKVRFSHVTMEILQLSPALITHGGPGCIVIQSIRK